MIQPKGHRLEPPRVAVLIAAWLGILVSLIGGCGRSRPQPGELLAPSLAACTLLQGEVDETRVLRIALGTVADPRHAPAPQNAAERLVFRQLDETLVYVDCRGEVMPGLAGEWQSHDGGRRWTFTLRPGACFWDGTPVEARDVRHAWLASRRRAATEGRFMPWVLIEGVTETDRGARTFDVLVSAPQDGPQLFAHPALAVARAVAEADWPAGTGAYRVSGWGAGELRCVPNPYRHAGCHLRFSFHPGSDGRDLLGTETDVAIIREREALDYAHRMSQFAAHALPWDRIYVLALAGESDVADDQRITAALRADLARDVAVSDAVAARTLSFDDLNEAGDAEALSSDACKEARESTTRRGPVRLAPAAEDREPLPAGIVYAQGDEDAARLAGRLVALAEQGEPSQALAASGLLPDRLRAGLQNGETGAYLTAVQRVLPDLCLTDLVQFDRGVNFIPLIASRAHLISRRGLAGVHVDWDGCLRFSRAGWMKENALP